LYSSIWLENTGVPGGKPGYVLRKFVFLFMRCIVKDGHYLRE